MRAKARIPTSKMNKTEAAYARVLEGQKKAGEIIDYRFEPFNIRLADRCYFRIDFLVIEADYSVTFTDVKVGWSNGKAGIEDDALVKLKTAAELYPWFKFTAAIKRKTVWELRDFT